MYDTKSSKKPLIQTLWHEIEFTKKSNIICGVVYRQHNSVDHLLEYSEETIDRYSASSKSIYFLGDVNLNIFKSKTCNYAQQLFKLLTKLLHFTYLSIFGLFSSPSRFCFHTCQ